MDVYNMKALDYLNKTVRALDMALRDTLRLYYELNNEYMTEEELEQIHDQIVEEYIKKAESEKPCYRSGDENEL